MACDTKERIIEEALRLFSEKGYAGTSMSDIAERLKITKAALYKHYAGKREIFQKILDRMSALDAERAAEYDMPGAEDDEYAEAYMNNALDSIRRYSIAQFRHWTEEEFPSQFRRMLTVEQYRDAEMARLYQNYLASGPVEYMAAIFRKMTVSDADAMQLALEFYGPMYLLYSVYDGAEDKEAVYALLGSHIDRFISRMEQRGDAAKNAIGE